MDYPTLASIQLQQIEKRYDNGHLAVAPTDLQITDGELLVLVGPSGCGKSTTLRLIAGLEELTAGRIFIGKRCVNQTPPGDRDIAMVFQNYALYPHMTVRDNMSFGLRVRRVGKAEIQKRVVAAAEILDIESLLHRRPKELSGGQRQRVALGRAIVRQPAAFLLDEPLSNLDAKLRVQMRTELARLHQKLGATMVYVTHDQVEAMTLGQRIVVMNAGIVQQIAAPMELYDRPANRFVASFIGSPAMNLVEGRIEAGSFVGSSIRYNLAGTDVQENQSVTLGFRPEDLTQNPTDPRLATVVVDVIERMGHEAMLYFQLGASQCVARVVGDPRLQPGQKLDLHLARKNCHLFDLTDGQRIGSPAPV